MTADADVQMQTVRVPKDLLEELKQLARASGRSVPKEIEHRLRQSVGGGAKSEGQASEWSQALGRLVTVLAHDVARHSQSPDEALARVEATVPGLMSGLIGGFRAALGTDQTFRLDKDNKVSASSDGQWLATRVLEAHLPPQKRRGDSIEDRWKELAAKVEEQFRPSLDQKELLDIQEKLLLAPAVLMAMAKKSAGTRR